MDIVLTGSYSYVMKALIQKLNKEGHRVFVISGNRFSQKKYPKVFEQYDFHNRRGADHSLNGAEVP